MRKAVCPNKCKKATFETTAHVMQSWEVDAEGNFLEELDGSLEVTHRPDEANIWTCTECGAQATFVDE